MTKGNPTVMRVLRERAGLTQEALGDAVGCGQPRIQVWETQQQDIPGGWLTIIAAHLGVDPAQLLRPWDDYLLDGGGQG